MRRMNVALVLVVTLPCFVLSCYHAAQVRKTDPLMSRDKIVKVAKLDGEFITFDEDGGHWTMGDNLITGVARTPDSLSQEGGGPANFRYASIPMDSVLQIWVKRTDVLATTAMVVGIAAGVAVATVALIAALKESCPFVYSWDGQQYVFDAEPLGGAICRALQRSECSRLEHLKAVDGQYRLMVRNEVPEIQYLDRLQLLVVDHNPNVTIVPDTSGRLHAVASAVTPVRAVDENGRSILSFVSATDGLAWQTHMSEQSLASSSDTRHHLKFEFPKPAGATHARVIFNAGTAIWGSNMIREMLQLHGDSIDAWYDDVNLRGSKLWELFSFNLREETYFMRLYADRNGVPYGRGFLLGGGPFVTEDRIMDIDISDIEGDRLVLSCNPPKTFWTLDYLAVEYDADSVVTPRVIDMSQGRDDDGVDITAQLSHVDGQYYVMKNLGDWAEIRFAAPDSPAPGLQRSIFLSTTGYYEVVIDKNTPEQAALLNRLLTTPGEVALYSRERFVEWHKLQRNN